MTLVGGTDSYDAGIDAVVAALDTINPYGGQVEIASKEIAQIRAAMLALK